MTDERSDPGQEVARLTYAKLADNTATQQVHGVVLGKLLEQQEHIDIRLTGVDRYARRLDTDLDRLDGRQAGVDTRLAKIDTRLDGLEKTLTATAEQAQRNHQEVMALLGELVGRKS